MLNISFLFIYLQKSAGSLLLVIHTPSVEFICIEQELEIIKNLQNSEGYEKVAVNAQATRADEDESMKVFACSAAGLHFKLKFIM